MMATEFALPPIERRPVHKTETRPARVKLWLQEFARTPPTEAARIIGDALAAQNRIRIASGRRLQLLELCNEAVDRLWPSIKRQFSQQAHPLNREAAQAARNTLHLMTELATGYKRLLAEDANKRLQFGTTRLRLGLIHRTQRSLARVLMAGYSCYCAIPPGTWLDLHQTYLYARRLGLHRHPINPAHPTLTPEVSYVQTLLLGLANPYGLLTGQLSRAVALLAEHCSLAELTTTAPIATDAETSFLAVIHAHTDQAPLPWAKLAVADEGDAFYLHTELLVNELRRQLTELENSSLPAAGSGEDFQRVQRADFLRRLERSWQLVAHRELPPPARDHVFTVSSGFTPVWQYLHADSVAQPRTDAAQLQVTSLCALISQTNNNGYVLRQLRPPPRPVRIGELLALRERADEVWRIAVVRWFRNTLQHQTLELGCELLARGGEAVTVLIDEAGRNYTQPSLFLAGEPDPVQPGSLLARPHTLSAHRPAVMRRGNATIPIKIGALREQSASFARFEVAYA